MSSTLGQAFRIFSGVTEIVFLVTGQQLFTFRKCCLDLRKFLYMPIILVKWPPDCITISHNCSYGCGIALCRDPSTRHFILHKALVCGDYILFLKSYVCGDYILFLKSYGCGDKVRRLVTQAAQEKEF